jgi:hypothetical protein
MASRLFPAGLGSQRGEDAPALGQGRLERGACRIDRLALGVGLRARLGHASPVFAEARQEPLERVPDARVRRCAGGCVRNLGRVGSGGGRAGLRTWGSRFWSWDCRYRNPGRRGRSESPRSRQRLRSGRDIGRSVARGAATSRKRHAGKGEDHENRHEPQLRHTPRPGPAATPSSSWVSNISCGPAEPRTLSWGSPRSVSLHNAQDGPSWASRIALGSKVLSLEWHRDSNPGAAAHSGRQAHEP